MTDSFPYIGGSPVAPGEPEPGGYFGPYRGIVTNTTDPAGQNRLKAVVPQLFGNTSTEIDWALPCQPAGYTATPNPGSGVWIMFEGGDINYPVYMGMWQEQASLAPWDPVGAAAAAQAASDPLGSAAAAQTAAIAASEAFTTAGFVPIPGAWTTYTPTWASSGVQPVLSNGTVVASYSKMGRQVAVRIIFQGGASTTVGTGGYTLSLPVAAPAPSNVEQVLAMDFYDGANRYAALALITGATMNVYSAKGGSGGSLIALAGGTAFSAGVGWIMAVQGVYESNT